MTGALSKTSRHNAGVTNDAHAQRVILFDFDGTLVNTTPLILRSFRATWEQVFGFALEDTAYIQTFGTLLRTALCRLTEKCVTDGRIHVPNGAPEQLPDFVEAKAEELLTTYRQFNLQWHDEMCQPFAGVSELLRELRARDYRLGVVSSKLRAGVERGLRLFALEEFFAVLIGAEDVTNHKPHPEPLLSALAQLDALPAQALYVGDSTHDIIAARQAQVAVAAACWGPFPRQELEQLQPDYLLETPGDLLSIC